MSDRVHKGVNDDRNNHFPVTNLAHFLEVRIVESEKLRRKGER